MVRHQYQILTLSTEHLDFCMFNIAVIGAGLSGLTVANTLKEHANITIFEKAASPSGRLSTRRANQYTFDHGCQFFGAKTAAFREFIAPMINQGVIQRWDAKFVEIKNRQITKSQKWNSQHPHYVGLPSMNAVGKFLSKDLNIVLKTPVKSIFKMQKRWTLEGGSGQNLGSFDWVISSIPAQQATQLFPQNLPIHAVINATKMEGCFSLMLGFDKEIALGFEAALVHGEDISWISVNNSKPKRSNAVSLLVNSTNSWATANSTLDHNDALEFLVEQTKLVVGCDAHKADHKAIHQWKYANSRKRNGATYFIDHSDKLGVCGDWLIQGRAEAAFTSGFNVAQDVLGKL